MSFIFEGIFNVQFHTKCAALNILVQSKIHKFNVQVARKYNVQICLSSHISCTAEHG